MLSFSLLQAAIKPSLHDLLHSLSSALCLALSQGSNVEAFKVSVISADGEMKIAILPMVFYVVSHTIVE